MRLPAVLSALLLGLITLPLLSRPAEARKRPRGGVISGRVRPQTALRQGSLRFLVDGVSRRARVRRGQFVLTGVPAGRRMLSVLDPSRNTGVHLDVAVRARGTASVGMLSLAPGGQIAGIVSRAPEDGGTPQPIPGVEVVAEQLPDREGGPRTAQEEPLRLMARTDDGGAYALRAVPAGAYRVSVVVKGLEAGVEFAFVSVGRTVPADFMLREAIEAGTGILTGTVTNAAGSPVAGALVQVYPERPVFPARTSAASLRKAARFGRLAQAEPPSLGREGLSTLTDSEGRYRLEVPSGRAKTLVSSDGYLPAGDLVVIRPDTTTAADFRLEKEPEIQPFTLQGTVFDGETGSPLPGVGIVVWERIRRGREGAPQRRFELVTDAAGEYRLELPASYWAVEASKEGYEKAIQPAYPVTEPGAVVQVDFKLLPARPAGGE